MAKIASDLLDVILGEAKAGDEEDMKAVISTIINRANALGVSPSDVVSIQSEFNAYGKPLPEGVEQHRQLAFELVNEIAQTGPTHDAMFYATPAAVKNLPKGLQQVAQTNGHIYFSDPQGRSIRTVQGFKKPQPVAYAANVAAPTPRPDDIPQRGRGLAALTDYKPEFRDPTQANLAPSMMDALLGTGAEMGAPLRVNSGYRSPRYNAYVGGARGSKHMTGEAADIDMSGMDEQQRQDAIRNLTQRGAGGFITYDRSPDMLHVDMRPRPDGQTPHFMHNKSWRHMDQAPAYMKEAAAMGGLPLPASIPTPTQNPLRTAPVQPVERQPLPALDATPNPHPGVTPQASVGRHQLSPVLPEPRTATGQPPMPGIQPIETPTLLEEPELPLLDAAEPKKPKKQSLLKAALTGGAMAGLPGLAIGLYAQHRRNNGQPMMPQNLRGLFDDLHRPQQGPPQYAGSGMRAVQLAQSMPMMMARDSAGGTTMGLGGGVYERTNPYGVTERFGPDGQSQGVTGGKGIGSMLSSLFD